MTLDELRKLIDKERDQLEVIATTRPIRIESFAEHEVLRQRLIDHERQLCLALKHETVIPLPDWSIRWTQNHTDVRLVTRQWWKGWLAFELLSEAGLRRGVLCEFKNVRASRLTAIDYDNIEQHTLYHSGLEGLGAYRVEFSQWIAGLPKENGLPQLIHFLFCFNSCLVECAAEAIEIVSEADSVANIWRQVPAD